MESLLPNFHKSISVLSERIKNKNKKETEKIIFDLLTGYELQCRYGVNKLEAFENSIITPSIRKKTKKEIDLKLQEEKGKSLKFRTFLRYEEDIKLKRSNNLSLAGIASYLNSHKAVGVIFSKQNIYVYCKKQGI